MLNSVNLQGRFCAQPEVSKTGNNSSVCSFTLACDRNFGQDKVTDFIPCVAWKETADFIAKWFHKGDLAVVSGQLQSRKYTDREGHQKTAYEVRVNNVNFCGSKSENTQMNNYSSDETFEEIDEDIPF